MSISAFIRNQIHENVADVPDGSPGTLNRLVGAAPKGSMLWQIHEHADTMFNMAQLELFMDELANLSPKDDDEAELLTALRSAAETAIRRHGYLWFSGD